MLQRNQLPVLDSTISYLESGSGPTAVFLHGNPTSSYIWRNIIPLVAPVAHCVAPDLIGFGESGKPSIEYTFSDQVRYLDAFLNALPGDLFLVAQDWGTALAFHYAARHPERIRGLAFMEFIHPIPDWSAFHQRPEARALFQALRTPRIGEKLVFEDNVFLEKLLPASVLRGLLEDELNAYRAPFHTPASRKPILQFPRELPIAGEPAATYQLIHNAHAALRASTYPKLLFYGDPGALISPAFAHTFAAKLENCGLVELGRGAHYLQEDHPHAIGKALQRWIAAASFRTSPRISPPSVAAIGGE